MLYVLQAYLFRVEVEPADDRAHASSQCPVAVALNRRDSI